MTSKDNRDKASILNGIVYSASCIMEMKVEETQMILEMFQEKGDIARVETLSNQIKDIKKAIEVMREHEGCWG